jgi:hypothetical protein
MSKSKIMAFDVPACPNVSIDAPGPSPLAIKLAEASAFV